MVYYPLGQSISRGIKKSIAYGKKYGAKYGVRAGGTLATAAAGARSKSSAMRRKGKSRKWNRKRKRKQPEYLESTQHNDISKHSFSITLRKPNKFFRSLGDFQYLESYQNRLTNLEGFQGIQPLRSFFTADAFISTTSNRNDLTKFPDTPFQLNPYIGTPGTLGSVIGVQTQPAPDYIHCKTIDCMLMIQNTSNAPQSIELNWFMCKKTSSLDPFNAWKYAINQKRLGQNVGASVSSTVTATNVAGYPDVVTYGQSPFGEKTFNKLWKTMERVSFDLQPGGTRKFLYKIHVNKTFSKAEQNQYVTQGTIYIANQTIVPMIITRPGIATIQDTGGATECTIAQASVGTIMTNHYTWSSIAAARLEYDRTFQGIVQGVPTAHTLKPENIVIDVDTVAAVLNL